MCKFQKKVTRSSELNEDALPDVPTLSHIQRMNKRENINRCIVNAVLIMVTIDLEVENRLFFESPRRLLQV